MRLDIYEVVRIKRRGRMIWDATEELRKQLEALGDEELLRVFRVLEAHTK
jgi:hypothetical protein